jgi:hypothetical protein
MAHLDFHVLRAVPVVRYHTVALLVPFGTFGLPTSESFAR